MGKHDIRKTAIRGETGTRNRRSDLLSEVVEYAPDAIWVLDGPSHGRGSYRVVYANAAFETVYETPRAEAVGQDVQRFLAPRLFPDDLARVMVSLEEGKPFDHTRFHLRKDGRSMWLQIKYQPRVSRGHVRWTVVARDVTDTVLAQRRRDQLARALDEVHEPVTVDVVRGGNWSIDYANRAFTRLLGYAPGDVLGKSWLSFLAPGADRKRAEDCRVGLLTGQQVRAELLFSRHDGTEVLLSFSAMPMKNGTAGQPTWAVTTFRDVTDLRREQRALQEQALRDPLTGLINRRELERILQGAIDMTGEKPAHMLLFIDLDRFKEINDLLGHDEGDRVLIAVSHVLKEQLLPSNNVARWGGDEFAAILYFCDLANGAKAGQRMIDALAAAPECRGVGASVGVIPITQGANPNELLRAADGLVYQAKAAGRNRVVTPAS